MKYLTQFRPFDLYVSNIQRLYRAQKALEITICKSICNNNFKDQAEIIKVLKVLRIPWTWVTRILEKFNGLLFLEDIQTIYLETHYSNILKYIVKLSPLVQESMYKFSISRLIIAGCTSSFIQSFWSTSSSTIFMCL
jgi:hypothetical protein